MNYSLLLLVVFSFSFILFSCAASNYSVQNASRLTNDLFRRYSKTVVPEKSLKVGFGLLLLSEDDFVDNKMSLNVWERYSWTDKRLSWNATEYGLQMLRLPPNMLWTPDITLYNPAEKTVDLTDALAVIFHTGEVLYIPPKKITVKCSENIYNETIECNMKFGSWIYSDDWLNLNFYGNSDKIDMADYIPNTKFTIIKNSGVRTEKKYSCCPESYVSLDYQLVLRRK